MSHEYEINYRAKNISFDDFLAVMDERFGATSQDISSEEDGILEFSSDCVRISGYYEDWHEEITNSLRKLNPNVLVHGEWVDVENPPTFCLGDDI